MRYRGKHARPLFDGRRLGEYLAMLAIEFVAIILLGVIWFIFPS